jgi:hypothetical protein
MLAQEMALEMCESEARAVPRRSTPNSFFQANSTTRLKPMPSSGSGALEGVDDAFPQSPYHLRKSHPNYRESEFRVPQYVRDEDPAMFVTQ